MAVYSMTGYATAQQGGAATPAAGDSSPSVGVEIRAVNSRFLDLAFKLPEELRSAEPALRELLTQALKRDSDKDAASAGLLAPELARRKQPLESYPLDTMSMVGSLIKQGNPVALVKVDNLLYQVSPGMYLGQNYGKIVKVGESEVVLREIVQDAAGEWIERTATLQLQERSK